MGADTNDDDISLPESQDLEDFELPLLIHPDPRRRFRRIPKYIRNWLLAALAVLVVILLALRLIGAFDDDGSPPTCRKSAAMVVFPSATTPDYTSISGHKLNGTASVLIWSGMAHGDRLLSNDATIGFDIDAQQWFKVSSSKQRHMYMGKNLLNLGSNDNHPEPRWKASSAALQHPLGMLLVGGQNSLHSLNDIWLWEFPTLKWKPANNSSCTEFPEPRRSHASVVVDDGGLHGGAQRLVMFGGQRHTEDLLGDTWSASIENWPNITWKNISVPSTQHLNKVPYKTPEARRGHSLVLGSDHDAAILFGGRGSNDGYLGDLWQFDLATNTWKEIQPACSQQPRPRDHHGAAYYNGKLVIFGGRGGPTSRPLSDMWLFDFKTMCWQEQLQPGLRPHPRYQHSYVQVGDSLYVFGGQTESRCKLNDLWRLNLGTLRWTRLAAPHWCKKRCQHIFDR